MPIPAAAPAEIRLPLASSQVEFPCVIVFAKASDIAASQLFGLAVVDAVAESVSVAAKIQPFTGIAAAVVACETLELVVFQPLSSTAYVTTLPSLTWDVHWPVPPGAMNLTNE